jgi:thymidylate kinase
MFSVAIIGGDGAGKTTVAKNLQTSLPLPVKYVYMGQGTQPGMHMLPTSRLKWHLKRRAYRRKAVKSGAVVSDNIPARHLEYGQKQRGSVWRTVRLVHRISEAWYRQSVALVFQLRGYVVVYDRHPRFDLAPLAAEGSSRSRHTLDGPAHWLIRHALPKPHLVILLDAPVEVLYERKGEATPEYLTRQRTAYLIQGELLDSFVCVDATQRAAKVLEDVSQYIMDAYGAK